MSFLDREYGMTIKRGPYVAIPERINNVFIKQPHHRNQDAVYAIALGIIPLKLGIPKYLSYILQLESLGHSFRLRKSPFSNPHTNNHFLVESCRVTTVALAPTPCVDPACKWLRRHSENLMPSWFKCISIQTELWSIENVNRRNGSMVRCSPCDQGTGSLR